MRAIAHLRFGGAHWIKSECLKVARANSMNGSQKSYGAKCREIITMGQRGGLEDSFIREIRPKDRDIYSEIS